MPPPHLHPRSSYTTSLFTTTLAISFLVVGLPHILPCPAPRVIFADESLSESPRNPSNPSLSETTSGHESPEYEARGQRPKRCEQKWTPGQVQIGIEERQKLQAKAHECPVPKPSGRLGQLLGFNASCGSEQQRVDARTTTKKER